MRTGNRGENPNCTNANVQACGFVCRRCGEQLSLAAHFDIGWNTNTHTGIP